MTDEERWDKVTSERDGHRRPYVKKGQRVWIKQWRSRKKFAVLVEAYEAATREDGALRFRYGIPGFTDDEISLACLSGCAIWNNGVWEDGEF